MDKLASRLRGSLRLPVIAAPMFLVSGVDLVLACCRAGVVGSFPTINARTPEILDEWLSRIDAELSSRSDTAPPAANLIVHPTNPRLEQDLAIVARHRVPLVISSVGNPAPVIEQVHAYGGLVFADVASLKHARRAAASGVDGLILLCAGAGGNTGWLSPFAFIPAVREFFDGTLVAAGCIGDGRTIRAVEFLGADLAYVGTRFIAAQESMASDGYRQMLIDSNADDIMLSDALTGIPANFLRASLERAGFDARKAGAHEGFSMMRELDTLKAWKDVWSAGQGVGTVRRSSPAADVVAELEAEYRACDRS